MGIEGMTEGPEVSTPFKTVITHSLPNPRGLQWGQFSMLVPWTGTLRLPGPRKED